LILLKHSLHGSSEMYARVSIILTTFAKKKCSIYHQLVHLVFKA
jgi:hypothetical protein